MPDVTQSRKVGKTGCRRPGRLGNVVADFLLLVLSLSPEGRNVLTELVAAVAADVASGRRLVPRRHDNVVADSPCAALPSTDHLPTGITKAALVRWAIITLPNGSTSQLQCLIRREAGVELTRADVAAYRAQERRKSQGITPPLDDRFFANLPYLVQKLGLVPLQRIIARVGR